MAPRLHILSTLRWIYLQSIKDTKISQAGHCPQPILAESSKVKGEKRSFLSPLTFHLQPSTLEQVILAAVSTG